MREGKDPFGDSCKEFEAVEAGRRFMPLLPVVARLDGKCFSKFTKKFKRPYDERMSNAMIETARHLMEETDALVSFCQSDEISIAWYSEEEKSQIWFDGRIQKMCSVLAAMASVQFNKLIHAAIPETKDADPVFDCRVWTLPTLEKAADVFLWREIDAIKNAVSMAASELYSHKELFGKTDSERQELMFRMGINFNDYPPFFKRGTYLRRLRQKTKFSTDEINKLPEKHEARKNPNLEVVRSVIVKENPIPLQKMYNRASWLFRGAEPVSQAEHNAEMARLSASLCGPCFENE